VLEGYNPGSWKAHILGFDLCDIYMTHLEECLFGVEKRVTEEMNIQLIKDCTIAEIEEASSKMHPLKSTGPDGYMQLVFINNILGRP
jgi:hypothetical protein